MDRELQVIIGIMGAFAVGFVAYVKTSYENSVSRCQQIIQESAIPQDRYFCTQVCERESLIELIDEYKLEDKALAYRLAQNRCGE